MNNFWTDEKVAEFFKEHWVRTTLKESFIGSDIDFVKKFREEKQPAKEWEIVKCKSNWVNFPLGHPEKVSETIISVKRLSDGEVFTVGDRVMYALACIDKPIEWTIDNFFIKDGTSDILVRSKDNINVEFLGTIKRPHVIEKPPLGLMPMFIHHEQRLTEINEAISRYITANLPIPKEWLNERETLISWTKKSPLQ